MDFLNFLNVFFLKKTLGGFLVEVGFTSLFKGLVKIATIYLNFRE